MTMILVFVGGLRAIRNIYKRRFYSYIYIYTLYTYISYPFCYIYIFIIMTIITITITTIILYNIIIYYYIYTFLLYISWVDVEEKRARQVRAIKIINKEKARFGDVAM